MNGFQESFEVEYWSNYSPTRSLPVFFLFLSAEFETLCRSKNNTFLYINMVNVEYANNNLNLGKKNVPVTFGAEATVRLLYVRLHICGPETEHVPLHLLQP